MTNSAHPESNTYISNHFTVVRAARGEAFIEQVFLTMLLVYGTPQMITNGGQIVSSRLVAFRNALEDILGADSRISLNDSLQWLKEYGLWQTRHR